MFKNREEAGLQLAKEILKLEEQGKIKDPVIVALPRGGVAVGATMAKELNAPMQLLFVKKIPAPFNEELAIGSISEMGISLINPEMIKKYDIKEEYLKEKAEEIMKKITEQKEKYGAKDIPLEDRDVILVDDGIATGASMYLAAQTVAMERPRSITIAVPVAPNDERLFDTLEKDGNLIVLLKPNNFLSVGQWYEDFHQLSDEEVINYIKKTEKL
jgi:predicted phosphoribosyltransferase